MTSITPFSAIASSKIHFSAQQTGCISTPYFGAAKETKKEDKKEKALRPLNPWKEGAKIGLKNAFRVGGLVSDGIYMALLTGLSLFTAGFSLAGLPFVIALGPVYRFLTGFYQGQKAVKALNEDILEYGAAEGLSKDEIKSEAESWMKELYANMSSKRKRKV